ncbi:hypothetical protein D4R20_02475 [bacterium]|nr:MAG: hypothetical protein D4R20_02475 [bacterium]
MKREIYNIPNLLSLFRIFLVIPAGYLIIVSVESSRYLIASILVLMFFTDILDGYIARKFNLISEIGKIIDPLADKIAIGAVMTTFFWLGRIPVWFFVIVILRDFLILLFGFILKKKVKITLMSNYPGKIAALSIGIILMLTALKNENSELLNFIVSLLYYISTILIIYSSTLYFFRFKKTIGDQNYGRQ